MEKRLKRLTALTIISAIILIMSSFTGEKEKDYLKKVDDQVRARQISDLKFGMFICWSFSTFSGEEWTPTEGKDAGDYKGYIAAEFTYPILPPHEGGAMWFYSLRVHDTLCLPAEIIYEDYLGAVRFGNIFSLDVGPDYAGRIRDIDIKTLKKVGRYIKGKDHLSDAAYNKKN